MNAPIPTAATSTLALMKAARRWLLRTSDKRPIYTNGTPRRGTLDSPEDVAQLVTYDEAVSSLDGLQATRPDLVGLGFALGPDGEGGYWQGIDLDHISARPDLQSLRAQLNGYVETSIGGDGLHAIGYGSAFPNAAHNGVEAYSCRRYFSFSGDSLRDDPPIDLAPFVTTHLAAFLGPQSPQSAPEAAPEGMGCIPVQPHVLDDLRSALNHLKPLATDYHAWIAIGQALADPNLCGEGKQLWLEWSAQDERFDPHQADNRWATFKPTATGYPAVFAKAQALGWGNPRASGTSAAGEVPVTRFKIVSLSGLSDAPPPAPSFWIEDLVPAKVITLLGAHGGTGKTMLGLVAAVCLATGQPFLGKATKQAKVLVVSGEDDGDLLRWRIGQICKQYGVDSADLEGWLTVLDATEEDPILYAETLANGSRVGIPTPGYTELKKIAADHEVLIIDNASDVYGADENARSQVRGFIRSLGKLVKTHEGAVILLVHIDKNTARSGGSEGYSGSTAWHNSARSRLFLKADEQGALILEHQKSNFAKRAEPIELQWSDLGVLTLANDGRQLTRGSDERDAVLTLIAEFYDRGEFISCAPSSPQNAWKVLHQQPSFPKRLRRDGLINVLRDAERDGLLEREQCRNRSRHPTSRWRLTDKGRLAAETASLF